jgi:hypothetical protein
MDLFLTYFWSQEDPDLKWGFKAAQDLLEK